MERKIFKGIRSKEKRGRGRPKGAKQGTGKMYEAQWTIAGKQVTPLYIESIKGLKLYMARLIRGVEEKLITTTIANTIIQACRVVMECIREHKSEKIIEDKIARLEELFNELRSKTKDNGSGEVNWPILITEARKAGKDSNKVDHLQ